MNAVMKTRADHLTYLAQILCDLERGRFYGSLELKFEAGRVVLLRKIETIKPTVENCRNNRGQENEQTRSD
jgi:hypothetical protein